MAGTARAAVSAARGREAKLLLGLIPPTIHLYIYISISIIYENLYMVYLLSPLITADFRLFDGIKFIVSFLNNNEKQTL